MTVTAGALTYSFWANTAAEAAQCDFGGEMVWSSTGPNNHVEHKKLVACGRKGNCIENLGNNTALAAPPTDTYFAACCADQELKGWRKRCDDKSDVWTRSAFPDVGCYTSPTYNQAVHFCNYFGGRLCTYEELMSDCAKNSGNGVCNIDDNLVWSSTDAFFFGES